MWRQRDSGLLGRLPIRRPPRVPDPGQRVRLLGLDGAWHGGFVAVSGPLSDDRHGVIVQVAQEVEFLASQREGRRPVTLAWPLKMLEIEA